MAWYQDKVDVYRLAPGVKSPTGTTGQVPTLHLPAVPCTLQPDRSMVVAAGAGITTIRQWKMRCDPSVDIKEKDQVWEANGTKWLVIEVKPRRSLPHHEILLQGGVI